MPKITPSQALKNVVQIWPNVYSIVGHSNGRTSATFSPDYECLQHCNPPYWCNQSSVGWLDLGDNVDWGSLDLYQRELIPAKTVSEQTRLYLAQPVDMHSRYKTRECNLVRIYAIDGAPDALTVHGAIRMESAGWHLHSWTRQGLSLESPDNASRTPHRHDLVLVSQRRSRNF